MWLAFMAAFFVWRADLRRRSIDADVHVMVTVIALAGVTGAKLYHAIQNWSTLVADPADVLFSRTGFAWFGGLIGGLLAIALLAERYGVPTLSLLDSASAAAALGYAIGRIGCLTSGDGDYGIPTTLPWGMSFPPPALVPSGPVCAQFGFAEGCGVHPTPMYELIASVLICVLLWKLGVHRKAGAVFAWFLLLSGVARFAVEFIRLNPPVMFGMSNAQLVSVASMVAGAVLLFTRARSAPARVP